ncbi:hypothetical protein QBC43DRAFT_126713 [Cladorrhinum sp. PSN259]|nr:hypothetical protein QBC43DRAFT_126713 [Cladorrhinum sp. PSN259]
MEGLLSVPPDRGTIIGRALWKPRYVVVGGPSREQAQQSTLSKLQSNRSSARDLSRIPTDGFYLSVYKSKDDVEPVQQHSIVSITDCQVQMIAHRKQGPVLATLVMTIMPDRILDKLRKRRSSRTAGFTTAKETGPTTLLFRYVENEPYTLQDWSRFLQQLIQPNLTGRVQIPLSPLTPASPTFVNPFSPRPGDGQQRPGSGSASSRPGFLKGINQTHSGRDRPMTFSDSPSLRSKRSDLSSATSSMTHAHMGFHSYSMMHPADLPSPATTIATTIGEYQGEFIEGWTSAQGRSSTLSSPIRERGSVSSGPTPQVTLPTASSPPGPRETILDRAFQLRCIPGTEEVTPGEEKLTSLARFDALMRDMDEKRRQREAGEAKMKADAAAGSSQILEPKSAWDMDSDSFSEYDDDSDDSDGPIGDMDMEMDDRFSSPPTISARRAFHYIGGRYEPPPPRSPLTYNHEALMALSSNSSTAWRPQTGYSGNRSRPAMSQRTHSQPQLATIIASSPTTGSALLEASGIVPEDGFSSVAPGSPPPLQRSATERQSTSSNKRLSFSEFTKRLSSTSSLLLVQTNNSTASSRGSNSDADPQLPQSPPPPLHHLHPRAAPQPHFQHPQSPTSPQSVKDLERCGWRGSVGVFGGAEGGFL